MAGDLQSKPAPRDGLDSTSEPRCDAGNGSVGWRLLLQSHNIEGAIIRPYTGAAGNTFCKFCRRCIARTSSSNRNTLLTGRANSASNYGRYSIAERVFCLSQRQDERERSALTKVVTRMVNVFTSQRDWFHVGRRKALLHHTTDTRSGLQVLWYHSKTTVYRDARGIQCCRGFALSSQSVRTDRPS